MIEMVFHAAFFLILVKFNCEGKRERDMVRFVENELISQTSQSRVQHRDPCVLQ